MRIKPTKDRGPQGAAARMLGLCVQAPELTDRQGRRFWEALPATWQGLPKTFIRHPNGTACYDVQDANDDRYRMVTQELFAGLPMSVRHDLTIGPQLHPSAVVAWQTARTRRIVYGNEPPMHIPSVWSTAGAYAQGYRTFVISLPEALRPLVWFQSGKEEVLYHRPPEATPQLLAKHQAVKEATVALVQEGYPPQVATTHKLRPDYPGPAREFYRHLLDLYRQAYGPKVRLLFHEYKLDDGVEDTEDAVLLLAEFLVVMSRIIYESDTVAGGAYQQGAGTGTVNLIGRDRDGDWTTGWLTELWTAFGNVLKVGSLVETTQEERPAHVNIEGFDIGGGRTVLLYSNRGPEEPLKLPAARFRYWSAGGVTEGQYRNALPAHSAGLIEL
jgi:hypothetical protein